MPAHAGDYQGGKGNGLAWYSALDAELLESTIYTSFSQIAIKDLNAAAIKGILGQSYPSAEAAPLVNYLKWVLTLAESVA